MPDAPGGQGRDTCPGPGWWLASDNKWYPPELAAENRAKNPAKKKVTKKKVTKKKPVAKKKAAIPATHADAPHPSPLELADDELPELTAPPPATEQIAARRMQAREQSMLLASDRRLAAMRALSSLSVEDEQVLVGVGGRSIDARSDATAAPPAPPTTPNDEAPVAEPDVAEPEIAEPEIAQPDIAQPDIAQPEIAQPGAPAPPAPESSAPSPPLPGGFGAGFARHQPVGPQPPTADMGLDAPFMEVRGSALGTDIDKIGEKILIFGDRVELLDRSNVVRLAIPYDQLAGVTITKKMMGPTLEIRATTGRSMSAKSLRPETATGAKAMIEKHASRFKEEGPPASAAPSPTIEAAPPPPPAAEVEEPEPLALVDQAPPPAPLAEPEPVMVESAPLDQPEPLTLVAAPDTELEVIDEAPPELTVVDSLPEPEAPLAPAPGPTADTTVVTPRVSQAVLVGMLEELTEAGVLTEAELNEKLALLDSLYR